MIVGAISDCTLIWLDSKHWTLNYGNNDDVIAVNIIKFHGAQRVSLLLQ